MKQSVVVEKRKAAASQVGAIGVIGVIGVLLLLGSTQAAMAQQGADCLECHTGLPATEANLITEGPTPATAGGCDYTFAADFDGWGWNASSGESCPPQTNNVVTIPSSSSCDYSNASQYGGWGWDPVVGQSCPPQESADPHARFPICSAAFYDADNDGFGWENEASCIVTSDSTPAPTFTNQQTGNQVQLTRAYWDGNTDLADRVVQCDLYYYDSYSMIYRTEDFPFRAGAGINNQVFPSYRFQHLALPPVAPYQGWISDVSYVDNGQVISTPLAVTPNWTTDDGRYIGPTILLEPYLELVTRNNGAKAVRTWVNSRQDTALNLLDSGNRVRRDGYFECYDISGRDLQPTGVVRSGTTSPRTLSDLVFTSGEPSDQQEPTAIRNLDTNSSVSVQKGYWNYNADLAGKTVDCQSHAFMEEYSSYMFINFYQYSFPYHFTNSENKIHYTVYEQAESIRLNNGALQRASGNIQDLGLFHTSYFEQTSQGVRFWPTSDAYTECTGVRPTGSAPTGVNNNTNNNQCDYSSADLFDGWGWNSVTRTSCPPVTQPVDNTPTNVRPTDNNGTGGCDYSNAGAGGWGWNPVTRTSCPPVNTVANNCDYSNAGASGWGWDPVARVSCAPR